jgi:hypothetical protein
VAAARWLRRWRQRNIVTSAAAWRWRGGGGSAAARQRDVAWRRCGGGGFRDEALTRVIAAADTAVKGGDEVGDLRKDKTLSSLH